MSNLELPKGWRESRLGDISSFAYGKMPKKDKLGKGCYPIFSGYKYQFNYPEKNCNKGDIIVVARGVGGTGDVKIVKEDCYLTNLSIKITLQEEYICPLFFYYKHLLSSLRYLDSGSAQSQITISDLSQKLISLPPLAEQKAIAEVLSSLDDKIDLLHQQNQTLEDMAQTLFREWFIEKADEGWEDGIIGDIAILKSGKSRPKNESLINQIPIYGGNGILGYTNEYNAENESIIIGRVGAYCGSLYYEHNRIWVSDNALLVKAKNNIFIKYIFYTLKMSELNLMAEGSSHPLLTQSLIKSIEISIPPQTILNAFNLQINEWYIKIESNKKQIKTLEQTRDTLLPKLMSGQVRV